MQASSVDMQGAIDNVRATVALAAREGASRARIQLSPESLGSIRIQLHRTDEGLVARVVADRPETAQALQQSAGELRRSLEADGQPLLRLDIEASGQGELPTRNPDRHAAGGSERSAGERVTAVAVQSVAALVELPGALVNVLA